jgi:LytS/YehU family sensor histidine kinase
MPIFVYAAKAFAASLCQQNRWSVCHGIGCNISPKHPVEDPFIEINLNINEAWLQFTVKNNFSYPAIKARNESGGIGLDNVRSRLSLLYPQNHTLVITENDFLFTAQLTLLLQ